MTAISNRSRVAMGIVLMSSILLISTQIALGENVPRRTPATAPKTPVSVPLFNLNMVTKTVGWAEDAHDILRTIDAGLRWQSVNPPHFRAMLDGCGHNLPVGTLSAFNRTTAWVAFHCLDPSPSSGLTLCRTTTAGQHWRSSTITDYPPNPFSEIASARSFYLQFAGPHVGWLAPLYTAAGPPSIEELLRTADGGMHWMHLHNASEPSNILGFMGPHRGYGYSGAADQTEFGEYYSDFRYFPLVTSNGGEGQMVVPPLSPRQRHSRAGHRRALRALSSELRLRSEDQLDRRRSLHSASSHIRGAGLVHPDSLPPQHNRTPWAFARRAPPHPNPRCVYRSRGLQADSTLAASSDLQSVHSAGTNQLQRAVQRLRRAAEHEASVQVSRISIRTRSFLKSPMHIGTMFRRGS